MMLLMMLNVDDYVYYRIRKRMEELLVMMMLNMVVGFEDLFDYDDDQVMLLGH
jgi:hypothetical protein